MNERTNEKTMYRNGSRRTHYFFTVNMLSGTPRITRIYMPANILYLRIVLSNRVFHQVPRQIVDKLCLSRVTIVYYLPSHLVIYIYIYPVTYSNA